MIGEPCLHLHHDERLGGELEFPGTREPAAWSAPRTWVAGEVLTASLMNVHLRDQLLWLGGTDGRLSAPPGAPIDGQLWRYVADATAGVEWLLAYNSGDATANKWHSLSGVALAAEVTASETTASAAYTALATAGPSLTIARGGDYDVHIGAYLGANGASEQFMSYDIGATGALDVDAMTQGSLAAGSIYAPAGGRPRRKAIAAATTLTAKYRTTAGTLTAKNRWMHVRPVRIA